MAQSGFTPIQIYYGTTTSTAPVAGNLALGELALNTTDGKLFYKNTSNIVTVLASITGTTSITTLGTVTTGTWNASVIQAAYGGTGASTLTGYVYGNGTSPMTASTTIPTTSLSGTISNAQLANSTITVNGNTVSLGGSTTITAVNPNALTIGTGLSGTSYNGSAAVTVAIDSTVVTLIGTQTLTNKTLTSPVISTITNTGTLTLPTSTDTLVGRATTDTLTNKTLTSPIISTISNTGTLTLPTSTDTLVGRATTDTLTNKSISGSTNTLSNIGNASLTNSTISGVSLGGSLANLTQGTNITFSSGTTYNGSAAITINATAAAQVYPGAGIANSTGTAWGTSYTTTGTGTVVALATSPTFVTPLLGTPASGTLTNTTGFPAANLAGTALPAAVVTSSLTAVGTIATGVWNGTAVGIAYGGTGQTTKSAAFNALSPITTTGDLIIGNGTNSATRLAIGADTYVLTVSGGTAVWAASTGGVTSFSAGTTGFTPSTATTGAVTLAGTLVGTNGGTGVNNGSKTITLGGNLTTSGAFNTTITATATTAVTLPTSGTIMSSVTALSGAVTGTPSSTTYLRGDGTWASVSASPGGSTTQVQFNNAGAFGGSASFTWDGSSVVAPQQVASNGLMVNNQTIGTSYSIPSGYAASSVGPISMSSGVSVTVPSGSRWVVL